MVELVAAAHDAPRALGRATARRQAAAQFALPTRLQQLLRRAVDEQLRPVVAEPCALKAPLSPHVADAARARGLQANDLVARAQPRAVRRRAGAHDSQCERIAEPARGVVPLGLAPPGRALQADDLGRPRVPSYLSRAIFR